MPLLGVSSLDLGRSSGRPLYIEDRVRQGELVILADRSTSDDTAAPTAPTLEQFLSGLRTAWQEGEARPTARSKPATKRGRRRSDPFAMVTDTLREWFEAEPWRSSGEPLERLRAEHPDTFTTGQIRTLQRRVKAWRGEVAHKLVFGDGVTSVDITADPTIAAMPG